jgi:hypothetical protein
MRRGFVVAALAGTAVLALYALRPDASDFGALAILVMLVGTTIVATRYLIRGIKFGLLPATLTASQRGLVYSNPAFDRRLIRRWNHSQLSYVLVVRSGVTATLAHLLEVIIVTSDGSKDDLMSFTTGDGTLRKRLETLLNRYLELQLPLSSKS